MIRLIEWVLAVIVGVSLVAATLGGADASDREVRVGGRMQWIAGQAMVVQLDRGGSLSVDLTRVPQQDYLLLTPNERIVVIGVRTQNGRGLIGRSIIRSDEVQSP
jgi:hypothetical protein